MQKLHTLYSAYNEVTFNEKSAIMKENLHTKYTPFTYNDIALNEKPPIMKQNLCIFLFIIGRVECTYSGLQCIQQSCQIRTLYYPTIQSYAQIGEWNITPPIFLNMHPSHIMLGPIHVYILTQELIKCHLVKSNLFV